MKYIIFLLSLSPTAFASPCEKRVEKIRNTPARLISKADYEVMLQGCPAPKYVRDYSKPILPDFDSLEDDSVKAKREAAEATNSALVRADLNTLQELHQFNVREMNSLDAQLSQMHAQQLETARALAATSGSTAP